MDLLGKQQGEGEPLCTNLHGEVMTETRPWFDDAVEAAKIDDCVFYALRHTSISRWVMKGVPLPAVSRFVGHSGI